jgi:putative DNA primase/helicase
MRLLSIALFRNKEAREPKPGSVSWEEMCEQLTRFRERATKDGALWSPTQYRAGTTRGKANVEWVDGLTLDFDDGTHWSELEESHHGLARCLHTSFSHTPEHPRWRVVFPLARPVSAEEWPTVYPKLAHALGCGHQDAACKDASRIYYLPSCPPDAARHAEVHEGVWLDPDAYPDLPKDPPRERPAASGRVAPQGKGDYATLDVEAWFSAHGCYGHALGDGRHTVECPWEREHTEQKKAPAEDTDTLVWEADGQAWPEFYCLHSHCVERRIQDVLEHWGDGDRYCASEFLIEGPALIFARPAVEPEKLEAARAFAERLPDIAKQDRGVLAASETLEALALLRLEDSQAYAAVKLRLGQARIPFKVTEDLLPAPGVETQGQPRRAGDMLKSCPVPELLIPDGYFLTAHATGRMSVDEDGRPKPVSLAYAPIILSGRLKDAGSGEESLLLSWKWANAGWESRVVERGTALTPTKIGALAGAGFPYNDEHSRQIVGYLTRLEATNRTTDLPAATVTSHLGWQGEPLATPFLLGRSLILPEGDAEETHALDITKPETWSEARIAFHGLGGGEEQLVDAFHAGGTYEDWLETISVISAYERVQIAFYTAFATPLLAVLGVPNFVVDYSNRTSTGKTTTLRVVASIYGNPDERSVTSLVQTWDVTRVYLERASHVISGLPLILDETQKAKGGKQVADTIYAVVSGRGRGRGNTKGINTTAAWHTVLFSTGEAPATSYTQDGGTRTRVLSICGMPFGAADADLGRVVMKLNRGLMQNYGHAGIKWLQWLFANRARLEEWRTLYHRAVELYSERPPTPEAGRLAQYAALVSLVGRLVHEALELPWPYTDPLWNSWSDLVGEATDAAGDVRALEHVMSWAYSHEQQFLDRGDRTAIDMPQDIHGPVAGRWPKDGQWIAFYPNVLREILRTENYAPEAILRAWRDRHWLEAGDDGRSNTVQVRVGEKKPHMVKILRVALDEAE